MTFTGHLRSSSGSISAHGKEYFAAGLAETQGLFFFCSSGGEEIVLDVNDNTSGDGRGVDGWEELNGFEVLDGRRWAVSNFQVSCLSLEKWDVVYSDEGYELDIDAIYDTKVAFSV